MIGNSRLGNRLVPHYMMGHWEMKSIPRSTAYHSNVGCIETPVPGLGIPFMPGRRRIIYNGPPSRHHFVAFYDMQGERRLLLPRSFPSNQVTFLIFLEIVLGGLKTGKVCLNFWGQASMPWVPKLHHKSDICTKSDESLYIISILFTLFTNTHNQRETIIISYVYLIIFMFTGVIMMMIDVLWINRKIFINIKR